MPNASVVARLMGGLGNQMFQYAAARALALQRRTTLLLDVSWFASAKSRKYRLGTFRIVEQFADDRLIRGFRAFADRPKTRGRRCFEYLFPRVSGHYVRERSLAYDPGQIPCCGSIYLDGYWQSPRYFEGHRAVVRQDFAFKSPPNQVNQRILRAIQERASVAIHVRRGDYIEDPATNQTHGTCSLAYYSQAITRIAENVKSPEFFVFSDAPDWARENLLIPFPTTYVGQNEQQEHEDLRLMTHCRHFIIANSTFSWWGAYLAPYRAKIVIAPRRWFARKDHHNPDLIPRDWIQL